MAAPYRKQTCFLCEMPRSPWAVLHDFTELVCRSCVNYEGPDRIEHILSSARRVRASCGQEGSSGIKREGSAPYPTPRMGSREPGYSAGNGPPGIQDLGPQGAPGLPLGAPAYSLPPTGRGASWKSRQTWFAFFSSQLGKHGAQYSTGQPARPGFKLEQRS